MKSILFLFLGLILFSSCSTDSEKIERDKKYGGTLRINMPNVPRSMYPPAIQNAVSSNIIAMIHAGLVKFNPNNLSVIPSIAKRWSIDSTYKVFTFYLRNNAAFRNDECFFGGKGRFVKAKDFVYTFELLCTQDSLNNNFSSISSIAGATKYYEASKTGIPVFSLEGVKAINDSTLQITIEKPNPAFVNILASPVYSVLSKEAVGKYGKEQLVGAGPFCLKEKPQGNNPAVLTRSENYFLSDNKALQMPYLDTIKINFSESSQKEINLFFDGQIDLIIGLIPSQMPQVVEKHIGDFKSDPPKYILSSASEENVQLFNLLYPYVREFYTNGMNYMDFSIVYFDRTPIKTIRNE